MCPPLFTLPKMRDGASGETDARSPRAGIPAGRVIGRLLAAALFGLVAVLAGPATPAAAHANLLDTQPADGTIVDQPPAQVVLSFSEPVAVVADRIVVIGPEGEPVDAGEPRAEGSDLVIPLGDDAGAIGTYLVSYRVISQDSHPVAGTVTFSVGAPSAVPELPAGQESRIDPTVSAVVSANKYLGYAGLVLVVGPVVLLGMLWPRRLSRAGVSRLIWTGLGLVALSTVIGVLVQVPYTAGDRLLEITGDGIRDVLGSTYGTAHVVRAGVVVAVALLLRPVLIGRATRTDLLLLSGVGVVGLGTWPFAGHAVASPIPAVSVLVNTAHVAAAAFWLGGLLVLAGFLLRLANERELAVILPEWSRWAAAAVASLVLAGLVMAVVEIGPPDALWSTSYGRLLLLKLGLVAVVVAVAGYSRRLVRQRLGATRPRAIRLAVGVEAAVLAGVLAVSSILVQTIPGRNAVDGGGGGGAPVITDYVATLETRLGELQILVEPAQQGSNTVHATTYTPEGQPMPVEEWRITAALPAAGVEEINVPVLALADNHALGEIALPVAGEWEFKFTIRISEVDQATAETTVTIR